MTRTIRLPRRKTILTAVAAILMTTVMTCSNDTPAALTHHYIEKYYPTPNVRTDSLNEVLGIILHHTALPSVEDALKELTRPRGVSSHVIIDTDGTRYILAEPTAITFHAGLSVFLDRERCNMFTIGVEFQGNTKETPLTEDQINSAIEYLLPIIRGYEIPLENIVTHKMVRDNYMAKYPDKKCKDKVDIMQTEYERVMNRLREVL